MLKKVSNTHQTYWIDENGFKQGRFEIRKNDGTQILIHYLNNKKHGYEDSTVMNGQHIRHEEYKHGILHGPYWAKSGNFNNYYYWKGVYHNGKKVGKWLEYDQCFYYVDGKAYTEAEYKSKILNDLETMLG